MTPILCTLGGVLAVLAFSFVPSVRAVPAQAHAVVGAAGLLLVWLVLLFARAARRGEELEVKVAVRRQHWLTACVQLCIYAYWGRYFPPVYEAAPLIAVQLCYAVTFDWLLSLSRRRQMTLGFGPVPIILSTNIFLWFKPEWFHFQFALVSFGFLAKELLRWERDGQRVHIFNPSSLPLAVFGLVLILTGTTDHTMGREIATSLFRPPWMYQFLFVAGLPGQLLFGVTPITLSAILTVYGFGLVYHLVTGTYYFFDTNIPIVVFLGMHLLATDPATSPRSLRGRIAFGALYGAGVVALYALLGAAHTDAFYDKLLPVPVLNLLVRRLDRAFAADIAPTGTVATVAGLPLRHVVMTGSWAAIFVVLTLTGQLSDNHPGGRLPFWRDACDAHRRNACENLSRMELSYCRRGSGWACNEIGAALASGRLRADGWSAGEAFGRACDRGVPEGCRNREAQARGEPPSGLERPPPRVAEYELLTEAKGEWTADDPFKLADRACGQGWREACVPKAIMMITGQFTRPDAIGAARILERACDEGDPAGCANLSVLLYRGDGVERDEPRARALRHRACELGRRDACDSLP